MDADQGAALVTCYREMGVDSGDPKGRGDDKGDAHIVIGIDYRTVKTYPLMCGALRGCGAARGRRGPPLRGAAGSVSKGRRRRGRRDQARTQPHCSRRNRHQHRHPLPPPRRRRYFYIPSPAPRSFQTPSGRRLPDTGTLSRLRRRRSREEPLQAGPVQHRNSDDGARTSAIDYITSLRTTYLRPSSTAAPSCSCPWTNSSAVPRRGWTAKRSLPSSLNKRVSPPVLLGSTAQVRRMRD